MTSTDPLAAGKAAEPGPVPGTAPATPARAVAAVADRFGPSALVTPANAVTVLRLVISPVLLTMILVDHSSWAVVSAWIVLAGSDGVDGLLARRFGTTRSGAFLDPLADKVLVLGALAGLVAVGVFWWLPVVLIAAREVAISAYRARLGRQGLAVPARPLAKAKTVIQTLAVGFALLPLTANQPAIAETCLWVAVAFALVSGAQYLFDGRQATTLGSWSKA